MSSGFSASDWAGALWRVVRVIALRGKLIFGTLVKNLRFTHALDRDWRERYAQSRLDFYAADSVYHPSRQWTIISIFYRLVLRGNGLKKFKSTFGRFLSTYEPDNPWIFEAVHHLYYQLLKSVDEWNLLETLEEPDLGDGTYVSYKGRRLSLDLLQSIDEFYRIREHAKFNRDDRVVFCEIGAGYGRLAHVVLSAMPNAVFMIFDLPESLLLSEFYLTSLHPNVPASLYPESLVEVLDPRKPDGSRLVFGLPHQMKQLAKGSVDVVANIYSFMEMSRDQIECYFKIIDEMDAGLLYLKQHKKEVNLFDQSLNQSDNYPFREDWQHLYTGTCRLFEHVFESVYRVRST
ncbi:MAG: hypothetical protein COB53_02590 [Elusimicrobia bacterium]|nr:MAG: hypothetical protein COB53_02590 [Elusimicrobiota bacterium]